MSERDLMRMSPEEVEVFLDRGRKAYVSTNGPEGWPHVVPLAYLLHDGDVVFWTDGASRKVRNLRADDRLSCLVEEGDRLEEYRAVQLSGRAEIIEDLEASASMGIRLFERYSEGPLAPEAEAYARTLAAQRVAVHLRADRVVSWDHRKVMVDLGRIGS